jgi:hypothetical protein
VTFVSFPCDDSSSEDRTRGSQFLQPKGILLGRRVGLSCCCPSSERGREPEGSPGGRIGKVLSALGGGPGK